ncbi:MAG: aspartate aminotransferase family protein [Halodesulfovibrio sp.]|uniref:pyridoxal phosphate-dependent decarboxylase family protein n=1 Tax=Halodesulfovibrio sp. TaxID=1912772 RepID=UPI00359DB3D6
MGDTHKHQSLDLEHLDDHLERVTSIIGDYIKHISDAPVVTQTPMEDIRESLFEDMPMDGTSPDDVLDQVEKSFKSACTRIGHPRFLAWITTSPSPAGTLGELLSVGFNQAPLLYKGSPPATILEKVVLGWFADLFGYPDTWGGTLVSGGTVANLMGMTVGRHTHAPEVADKGMQALDKPLTVYVSDQGHMSIYRSAMLLGIGHNNVRSVPTDDNCRMIPEELRRMVETDRVAGMQPYCVIAQAGAVSTGSVDPLNAIADICEDMNLWLHVDASYGGAAMISDKLRPLLDGIDRADSIAVDPHKWFFIPLECGITLFKNKKQQKETFIAKAVYLGQETDWDLKNTNFQLSRQGRALKLWFAFKTYGVKRLAEIVDRNHGHAKLFHKLTTDSPNWETVCDVELSMACARYIPDNCCSWSEAELDNLQVAILSELEKSGLGFMTPARICGKGVIRLCVANHRTTDDDITLLYNFMTETGATLAAQHA